MSFVYIENRIGEWTHPCGASAFTMILSDSTGSLHRGPFSLTCCGRSHRNVSLTSALCPQFTLPTGSKLCFLVDSCRVFHNKIVLHLFLMVRLILSDVVEFLFPQILTWWSTSYLQVVHLCHWAWDEQIGWETFESLSPPRTSFCWRWGWQTASSWSPTAATQWCLLRSWTPRDFDP